MDPDFHDILFSLTSCVTVLLLRNFDLFFFFFFLVHTLGHVELPQLGIEPTPSAVEQQSLNRWTTREATDVLFFFPLMMNFGMTSLVCLKKIFISASVLKDSSSHRIKNSRIKYFLLVIQILLCCLIACIISVDILTFFSSFFFLHNLLSPP